jgi:hypothetical protein
VDAEIRGQTAAGSREPASTGQATQGPAAAEPEIIGIDHWCDPAGMMEHYRETQPVYAAFVGSPQTSVGQQAQGGAWSEW